jgi:biotin synthase
MAGFFPSGEMLSSVGGAQSDWHGQAWESASATFGGEVFVRGVVEVSNYCRENCDYCGMRRDNRALERHRATVDQLSELLIHHRPASITDLNFQTGEDPVAARRIVLPLIRLLKEQTDLGVSVCLGTLDEALYRDLKEAGAGMYIIKFETSDEKLYAGLKAPGTLDERELLIRLLADVDWFVSSGFIAGLPGQSMESLLGNFEFADDLPLGGCSVSPFIPGEATPLAQSPAANIDMVLNCMAALRLMNPNWVIPAVSALNLGDREDGYVRGLRAGANLCTINMTPPDLRGDYLLYRRDRFIMTEERILNAIESAGLARSAKSLSSLYSVKA